MGKTPRCPEWKYESHPHARDVLRKESVSILNDLTSRLDAKILVSDTRPVHRRLFSKLTLPNQPYLAGHYRGENFECLKTRQVGIPSNPRVGLPPRQVGLELSKLNQVSQGAIGRLDTLHQRADSEITPDAKLTAVVAVVCRVFAQFLLIHPYVYGNGHVGRIVLIAILGRFGYWPIRFSIEPRPFGTIYDDAIRRYQWGDPNPLEMLIMSCVSGLSEQ